MRRWRRRGDVSIRRRNLRRVGRSDKRWAARFLDNYAVCADNSGDAVQFAPFSYFGRSLTRLNRVARMRSAQPLGGSFTRNIDHRLRQSVERDWSSQGGPLGRGPHSEDEHREGRAMFAVIKTGGKQYKVAENDEITIEKLPAAKGDAVEFSEVLMLGRASGVEIGKPFVQGVAVSGEVVDQTRGEKVYTFKKRRRKHSSKRIRGHRQNLTVVRITGINGADA